METKTRAADANEFCLVLTATLDAGLRASEAVRERFRSLPQETRRDLAAVVAELVQSSVERRPGGPITVTVVVGSDEIHGEVSDHGKTAITPRVANGGDQNGNGLALVDRLTGLGFLRGKHRRLVRDSAGCMAPAARVEATWRHRAMAGPHPSRDRIGEEGGSGANV